MKASILSFTRKGANLSIAINDILKEHGYETVCYTTPNYAPGNGVWHDYEPDLKTVTGELFKQNSLLVFVSACGIAVRTIAPWIKDKRTDPAVICLDEKGKQVIPLLSGHIGGANRMARVIAAGIGAQPVITTATDINGLFAVDEWARKNDLWIQDMAVAKEISASLIDGKTVGLHSDFTVSGDLPEQLSLAENGERGICLSLNEAAKPFRRTLLLIPKIVCLGLGCRKGAPLAAIEELVLEILLKNNISLKALAGVATIVLKEQEAGVRQFAAKYSLPLTFFSANELAGVRGEFSGSNFVKQVAGIDNVCERAAVLLSNEGELIGKKTVKNGVTAALALKRWRVNFED